jgi:hypothetical protein
MVLMFILNSILSSGIYKHLFAKFKGNKRSWKPLPHGGFMGKEKNRLKVLSFILITIIVAFGFSSCGYMLYDLINGGTKGGDLKHSIRVNVQYSGARSLTTTNAMYIIVYEYDFSGSEPDIVYSSDPILSSSGSYTFDQLEEMSYGVVVFIDVDGDYNLSGGDVYQFYNGTDYDPDEIVLESDREIDMFLDDSYLWVEGFYEDFEDGVADNWIDDGSGKWSLSGYSYDMTGVPTDTSWVYSYYNDEYSDFTYRVEVEQKGGSTVGGLDSQRGIFFRCTNTDLNTMSFNGYMLLIDSTQGWYLDRGIIGSGRTTIDAGTSTYLMTGYSSNTIEITCSGNTITIFFNGNWVKDVTDTSHTTGKVGICAWDAFNTTNEYWFDDIALYYP